MYIILSQRRDTESQYMDELYSLYHFPARYRNQIHPNDLFVYYQGDRYVQKHRYYYGTGRIGKIYQTSEDDYYAELIDCKSFNTIVPIYKDDGYIESIDYQMIRKGLRPPWQSSIRPLSEKAAAYILSKSGGLKPEKNNSQKNELDVQLKSVLKSYYIDGKITSIKEVIVIASKLAGVLGLQTEEMGGK